MIKLRFKKAMSVSYVLVPMMLISISLPLFYVSYTTRDINNAKKVLQEAAYEGALAGTRAIDISAFENARVTGVDSNKSYPLDKDINSPAVFMLQKVNANRIRKGTMINQNDCLGTSQRNDNYRRGDNNSTDEVVSVVEEFLKKNFKINTGISGQTGVNDKEYGIGDYSIAVRYFRDGLVYENGSSADGAGNGGPFNSISVSVSMRYKPLMFKNLFKDSNGNPTPVALYGTSTAKTKTII